LKAFEVVKPGIFTTVQDLGRHGLQKYGVPISGAMDKFSFIAANILVGNSRNDACLEITLIGPELKALNNVEIAVTGAEFPLSLNGQRVPMWETLSLQEGDMLSFGKARKGCRAYLSIKGGIDVPMILGSRSTDTHGKFGGLKGRTLRTGDIIETFQTQLSFQTKFSIPTEFIPEYSDELTVKVILGPQVDMFSEKGLETFLSNPYEITAEADRVGYRLKGSLIEHENVAEIVSDALVPGAVQVPKNGIPIIVMLDAPTTGGYPKIAVATTPSLCLLAQAKPGSVVCFSKVSLSQAQMELRNFYRHIEMLEKPH